MAFLSGGGPAEELSAVAFGDGSVRPTGVDVSRLATDAIGSAAGFPIVDRERFWANVVALVTHKRPSNPSRNMNVLF